MFFSIITFSDSSVVLAPQLPEGLLWQRMETPGKPVLAPTLMLQLYKEPCLDYSSVAGSSGVCCQGVPPCQAAIPRGPVHRDGPRGKAAWKPSSLVLLPSAWEGD